MIKHKWVLKNLRNQEEFVLKKRTIVKNVRLEANHPFIVRMSWNGRKKITVNGLHVERMKYLMNKDILSIESEMFELKYIEQNPVISSEEGNATNSEQNLEFIDSFNNVIELIPKKLQRSKKYLLALQKIETEKVNKENMKKKDIETSKLKSE